MCGARVPKNSLTMAADPRSVMMSLDAVRDAISGHPSRLCLRIRLLFAARVRGRLLGSGKRKGREGEQQRLVLAAAQYRWELVGLFLWERFRTGRDRWWWDGGVSHGGGRVRPCGEFYRWAGPARPTVVWGGPRTGLGMARFGRTSFLID
jgi:hypothetical protein